jgi:CheY-like chemotaxis protein
MYLPVASPALAEGHVAERGASVAAAEQVMATPVTAYVLVVEDEPNVRDLVLTQLTALGYTADAVEDAPSALAAVARADYEVLLTDVILPGGMNGRELADRIAALRPELRVMFTSGYAQQAVEIQGMLMPGATLLHKPFRKVELGRKLQEVVAGKPYADVRAAVSGAGGALSPTA